MVVVVLLVVVVVVVGLVVVVVGGFGCEKAPTNFVLSAQSSSNKARSKL